MMAKLTVDDQGKIVLPQGVLNTLRRGKAKLVVRLSLAADGSMQAVLKSAMAKRASGTVKHYRRTDRVTMSNYMSSGWAARGKDPKVLASSQPGRVGVKATQSGTGKKLQEPDDSELKLVDGVPVFDVEIKGIH